MDDNKKLNTPMVGLFCFYTSGYTDLLSQINTDLPANRQVNTFELQLSKILLNNNGTHPGHSSNDEPADDL